MNVTNATITNTIRTIADVATIRGTRVKWDYANEVEFRREGDRFQLRSVRSDNSNQTIWMSSTFESLPAGHRQMVLAAAQALRLKGFFINREFVVLRQDHEVTENIHIVRTTTIELVEDEPVKHATQWAGAQPYALSGYRKEPVQQSSNHEGLRAAATLMGIGLSMLSRRR